MSHCKVNALACHSQVVLRISYLTNFLALAKKWIKLTTLVIYQKVLTVELFFDTEKVQWFTQQLTELRVLLNWELWWDATFVCTEKHRFTQSNVMQLDHIPSGPWTIIFLADGTLAVSNIEASHCSLRRICFKSLNIIPCTLWTTIQRTDKAAPTN